MPGGAFVLSDSSGGGFARGRNCAGELLPGVLLQRRYCGGGFVGGGMSVNHILSLTRLIYLQKKTGNQGPKTVRRRDSSRGYKWKRGAEQF